jgi:hypothetical protein
MRVVTNFTDFDDPAERAIGGDLRDEVYGEDLHEDETHEEMTERLEREAYIEAAHKLLPVIVGTLNYVTSPRKTEDVLFRLAVVSHYFGVPVYAGKSMAEICEAFGKTRAAGSHASLAFQREHRLPEMIGQKDQRTRAGYFNTIRNRITSCKTN